MGFRPCERCVSYWTCEEYGCRLRGAKAQPIEPIPSEPVSQQREEPLKVADEAPSFGTWQPIESAPKDGTNIWVWDAARLGARRARYELSHGDMKKRFVALDHTYGIGKATHWMPEPPAPTEVDQEGEENE